MQAPPSRARLPLRIEYNIHDTSISSIVTSTTPIFTPKIIFFDLLTLASIIPLPSDDSDFMPSSIPLPDDNDEDFDLHYIAILTPLPDISDEDLVIDPSEVPLPDNDDGLVIDPTTVPLPTFNHFDFDPLVVATVTPLPCAINDELYIDPFAVPLPFSSDEDLNDLYLACQASLPPTDVFESFSLDPLSNDLPDDNDDALDLLLDSLDILIPNDYTASGPSIVVDSQPSIQQQVSYSFFSLLPI